MPSIVIRSFFFQTAKLVKAPLVVRLVSTQVVTPRPIIDTLLASTESADDEDAAIALMLALRVLFLTPAQSHGRIRWVSAMKVSA